ncbi:MBG domain-containing protein [Halopseudomonas aestusnigri]|uniref:beta strand repeat-containing protein n=1 Tax=Halopseudomonas aestusnigri TaxID=857252 RepID=UPI0025531EA8|nr:MBG domain-containing protein [Halopseudomonas aestusnigri]MDL2198534.1 MBG domain-containing protein [Halopseudomonas aestusnigri]
MNRSPKRPNFAPTALAIAISLCAAQLHAADLPTGGNIVGGSGSISQDGNSLNVQQNSDKLITNWDSFDIGAGNTVNFYQPGSNSVALNRVIGEDASAIYGNLNANGKVFLVNPNGVLFGQGAAVNVGALVASTLSLSDEDFNDGNYQFSGDGNNAAVINRGTLNADQGAVALLGGQVSNHGIIQANQGTVALAAGDKITLDFAGDGLLNVTVDKGTIDALVENHQLVRANGGQVIMTANATNALLQTVVNNTGIVEAQTLDNQSGTIVLKGGFNGGTVNVAGTLDASAPDSGDGGFIDTSGAHVKIAGGTQVTTKANHGTTGEWLIDPTDFTISDSSDPQTASGIGAATLSANLENNNVTLETVDTGTEPGDMYVNGAVSWSANTTLSLDAHNDIHINEAITATNGGLTLNAGGNISAGGAVNVDTFNLQSGAWSQLGATLPAFYARDFQMDVTDNLHWGKAYFLRSIGGDGSKYNPYQLTDVFGLQGVTSRLLIDKSFTLANDIDASGTVNWAGGAGFVPIGGQYNRFSANFSGQGHVIRDLHIFRPTSAHVGLFGVTDKDSAIHGVGLVNVNIVGRTLVGALVGYSGSDFYHSYATGTVTGRGDTVGGLIGQAAFAPIIRDSWADVTVSANGSEVGGLVGRVNAGDIRNSFALGDVTGHNWVGGLVGTTGSKIYGTYATGKVTGWNGVGGLLGGFAGGNPGQFDLANSYATGDVVGSGNSIGGLIGWNSLKVTNIYATGNVVGDTYVGGLVGQHSERFSNPLSINAGYATGTVQANTSDVGALVGKSDATITVSFFNQDKNPLLAAVGLGSSDGTTSLTTAQMMDLDSFSTAWGPSIDADGGTGSVWRIYDGSTTPLLRSFLTPLTIDGGNTTVTYNGLVQTGQWTASAEYDADLLLGNEIVGKKNVGSYELDLGGLYSSQQGYDLVVSNGTLTINKAQATVTANSGTTTYNGTEQSISGFTVDGLVNGEDESVVTGVTTSGGKGTNAGSYVLTVSGGSADNYELSFVDGTLTINKAKATVTANSGTTTYNGTEQGISGFTVDGLVNGEDESVVTGVTTSGGKGTNAGSYVLTVSGGSADNYELSFVDGALTINKAKATVTANSGTTTYNGTEQSVSGFTVDGLVNGEDQSVLTGVTTSGGKGTNAGSYVLTVSGGSADNYELSFVDGALTINKAQATVTSNSGTTTYNGTEQSVSGFTVDGLVNGEDQSVLTGVTTSGGKGTNAGSYVLTASGTDGNYELTFVDGALTINKAKATVTANSGTTSYNGTEQSVDGFTVDGLVNGEDQSVLTGVTTSGGKGTNAGSYTLTASGSDGNYELTFVDGTLTINKAQATVTANSGTTTYNGTEQSVDGFTVEGLVNGEDQSVLTGVTTSGGKGTNAGSYTLTASGTDGNYELSFVDGVLTINKAQATVTANSSTTTYNGTEQNGTGFTVNGLVNGEDQSVLSDVTVSGGGRNAGSYVLTASGTDGNYELTFVDGTLTINKAQATVTANSGTTTYNGTEQSVSGFTVDGLVNGEDASVLSGVTTNGGTGTNAGTYVLTASGSDGNYELTFVDGALTIDRKTITADIRALDKLFDGSLAATLEGVLNGTISGDDVALQLSGLFASLKPGENRVLVDASLTGADAGNYQLVAPDSVTASLLGFVQTENYQSANVSQPPESRQLSAPGDAGYVLDIDDDALRLTASGQ